MHYLTLKGPLAPHSHRPEGHGVQLVEMGGTTGLSVCACEECDIESVAGWWKAWPTTTPATASKPTLLMVSRPQPVIESMELLHNFLEAHGHTGADSRAPRDPVESLGKIRSAMRSMLDVIRPPPDPWGSKWKLNGDHGHLSRDLERGLNTNLASHDSCRPLGQRATEGYTRAVEAAMAGRGVVWGASEQQELERQRAHQPEPMMPETCRWRDCLVCPCRLGTIDFSVPL